MPNCPLAEECPSFSERIEGMGCQHYGDRGGAEWCNHYNQPIRDLKQQPVKPGEEVVVDVTDIHESGAGVGRTEDGFILLVDGALPEARVRAKVIQVRSNHAKAESVERLPTAQDDQDDQDDLDESAGDAVGEDGAATPDAPADTDAPGDADADTDAPADADADADTEADSDTDTDAGDDDSEDRRTKRERLGSRENFWGAD